MCQHRSHSKFSISGDSALYHHCQVTLCGMDSTSVGHEIYEGYTVHTVGKIAGMRPNHLAIASDFNTFNLAYVLG